MDDSTDIRLKRILRGRQLPSLWAPNLEYYDQVLQFGFAQLLEKALSIQFGQISTEIVHELHDMEPFTLHLMFEMLEEAAPLAQIMDDARLLDRTIRPVKRRRFPLMFPVVIPRLWAEVHEVVRCRSEMRLPTC